MCIKIWILDRRMDNPNIKDDEKCPEGQVLRKGYTRRFKNSILQRGYSVTRRGKKYVIKPETQEVRVRSSCVGKKKPTSIKRSHTRITSHLRRTDLRKYGYMFYDGDIDRRRALVKAIRQYGVRKVYNHLDSAAKLYAASYPSASKTFRADKKWIKTDYVKIANLIKV